MSTNHRNFAGLSPDATLVGDTLADFGGGSHSHEGIYAELCHAHGWEIASRTAILRALFELERAGYVVADEDRGDIFWSLTR
jgi:hypothetical protein